MTAGVSAGSSRVRLLAFVALLIPLGFATKWYQGPGEAWVQAYAGAVCYVLFWIFLLKALVRSLPIVGLAAGVFVLTSLLEVLQLSRHPWLEWVRSFFLGRALIGDGFDPWDFLAYAAASAAAVALYPVIQPASALGPVERDSLSP